MKNESGMAMMEEEVAKMDALKQEGEVRAATDAEIQEQLDRLDARDHLGATLEAYLEQLARRVFGLDKRAIDTDIQRGVDAKHIAAEELNARYDTLRENLTQAYDAFKQFKKTSSWPKDATGTNGFIRTDTAGNTSFEWTYKDAELEGARQQVLLAKKTLEDFVNEELYEGSDKDYRQSRKAVPFNEQLLDIEMIGLE